MNFKYETTITNETDKLLNEIKEQLQTKGFKYHTERTDEKIDDTILNWENYIFQKNDLLFMVTKDFEKNTIFAKIKLGNEYGQDISLENILRVIKVI